MDHADERGIEGLRARIRAQADAAGEEGWTSFPVPPEISPSGTLRVPRGAFERWSVSRAGGDHLTIPWEPVSPGGMKIAGDDRYHTDWLLGAGLPLDAMGPSSPTREVLTDAADLARSAVSRRLLDHEATVLLAGPDVVGRVHRPADPGDHPLPDADGYPPVLLIRDASADYLELAIDALDAGGAVVVQRGGQMAHLVTVLREDGRGPILRMPDALRLYPEGSLLEVSPAFGGIRMRDDGRLSSGQRPPWDEAPATPSPPVPRPGIGSDGPPDAWPLRIVGEDELRRLAEGPEPDAFELAARDPDLDHPAEACGYEEPRGTFEVRGMKVRAKAHKDAPNARETFLELVVHEDGTGRRASFYAPRREWGPRAVRRAADRAIEAARALFSAPEPDVPSGPAP